MFYYTLNKFFLSRFALKCFQSLCQLFLFLRFSQFFLFHVISKQLLCHLRRPFCVLWVLVFNYFSDVLLGQRSKPGSRVFASSMTGSINPKRADLTWVLLEIIDMIIVKSAAKWRPMRWFRKFTVRFRPIRKEIVGWMYNNANIKFYYNNNDSWKSINQIQKYSLVWNWVW